MESSGRDVNSRLPNPGRSAPKSATVHGLGRGAALRRPQLQRRAAAPAALGPDDVAYALVELHAGENRGERSVGSGSPRGGEGPLRPHRDLHPLPALEVKAAHGEGLGLRNVNGRRLLRPRWGRATRKGGREHAEKKEPSHPAGWVSGENPAPTCEIR